ncbi:MULTISPECIES: hypothetical protein [Achromobacter]|jgi:hypothetical protein|uniref:hypothetical protein n=1 Tax=Achromobacter TaxID=222 RepID=UPI001467FE57|nr:MULTISPECIES: hypothetical protein [Achromobacter]CAB3868690.1 hypothetical protein LMG3410_02678 [Achromobacter aegrifaciens]
MSAQLCTPSSSALAAISRDRQQSAAQPVTAPSAELAAPRVGFIARLAAAYRKRRNEARLRHLAADLDEHMLQDLGAPRWLMNEAAVKRDLARLRDADYLRW